MASKDFVGNYVELTLKNKERVKGILLESYDKDVVLIKIDSGYNIGFHKKDVKSIEMLKPLEKKRRKTILTQNKDKPSISMIITGGTIASKLDYKTGGVRPLTRPEELFQISPRLLDIVKIRRIERPFQILSENMEPKRWKDIAATAARLLNEKENEGIIITHGTDTLHYTSAALSFMLRDLNKPVCLTYSQRSIDRASTDAALNLQCSGYAALSDMAEVMIVGHANSSDTYCIAIQGTKAYKFHTSRRDTFKSVNAPPLAKIFPEGIVEKIKNYRKKNPELEVNEDTAFEEKTALIKYYPGSNPEILHHLIDKKFKGIVIEGTGFGHVATEESSKNWLPVIKRAIQEGIAVAMTSQALFGRVQKYVYATGRKLSKLGVIYCEDMLSSTAYVKLGWILGHTQNEKEVRHLMLTNMAGEINKCLNEKDFL